MNLPFNKLPKAGNALGFRLVNPKPVKYSVSWSWNGDKKIYPRWVYFIQPKPFSMAQPGNVQLLDVPKSVYDQFVELDEKLKGAIRTHELAVLCSNRYRDRRNWMYSLVDCCQSSEFDWCQPNETNLFSYNSLLSVARHRMEKSTSDQIRYLEVFGEADTSEPEGASMAELFDPAHVAETPATKEPVEASKKVEEKIVLDQDCVNVMLYDARRAKAPKERTDRLLAEWFRLTGRRTPRWW